MSGVYLNSAAQNPFTNSGRIAGGAYGIKTAYIAGLSWDITNTAAGLITEGGGAGVGVSLLSGVFTNEGQVVAHGAQATGVYLHDAALVNDGTIRADTAIVATTDAYYGQYGYKLNKTTVTNAGTIIATGQDAIVFETSSDFNLSVLKLDTGSVIEGDVVWAPAPQDPEAATIELAAQGSLGVGVISGLGTQYRGFGTIEVDAGAQWSIQGANNLNSVSPYNTTIELDAGSATIARASGLTATSLIIFGPNATQTGQDRFDVVGSLGIGDTLDLEHCTLAVAPGGIVRIGHGAGAVRGDVNIRSDGTLRQGGGVVSTSIVDDGVLYVDARQSRVEGSISGAGQVVLGSYTSGLTVEGALSVALVSFQASELDNLALGRPADCTAIISGFAAQDTIDLLHVHGTSLSWSDGVLTVRNSDRVVSTLHLAGSYTSADFALADDGHGGTKISFVGQPGGAAPPPGASARAHALAAAMATLGAPAGASLHETASLSEPHGLLVAPRLIR